MLDPDLRDQTNAACDIPNPIQETIKSFKDKFPLFDTSLIELTDPNPDLWFLANGDKNLKQRFMATMPPDNDPNHFLKYLI